MDRKQRLEQRRVARNNVVERIANEIKSDFPEVDHISTTPRGARLIAWDKNCCIIAESTAMTFAVAAEKLVLALGYRRERMEEMEAQRRLFNAAVPQ